MKEILAYQPLKLNPKQKEAAEAPTSGGPLLIVAGAGTGKTRTLTSRILFLISQGIPADSICAITFTNKAAREMEGRVVTNGKWLMANGSKPYLGTFHALGARILRKESKLLGRTPAFVIFDNHDSLQVVKKVMKQLGIPLAKGRQSKGTPEGPAHFAGRISDVKNGIYPNEGSQPFGRVEQIDDGHSRGSGNPDDKKFVEIYKSYEQSLKDQNAFDFDDLLSKVVALFKQHPEVLEKYRRKFTHVLVDEYQDLNNVQYELIRLLAGHTGNVSVVGDWRQIIFSWRGSNPEIFTNFEKHWKNARVVTLDENYRSSSNIITVASALFASQPEKQKQSLWTQNPEGMQVKLVETMDEEDEAEGIAERIFNFQFSISKDEKPKTTAILYRTNAQSRAIEQALLRRNIPYEVYGGLKFYERREIKDIVAGLRYAGNQNDEVSRDRLEKTFSKTRFREFQSALVNAKDINPLALIKLFLSITDYFDYMDRNYTNAFERRENIAELMRFASEFSELPPLLEQLSLLQATDRSANSKSQIANREMPSDTRSAIRDQRPPTQLMTMHLAKGLEFDRVFVTGASEGLLPHSRSLDTAEQLEEERRLLYVAMTRARHELIISFYDLPSRFLSEIPQELLKFESAISDADVFEDGEERYITFD